MIRCPKCWVPLARRTGPSGITHHCPTCSGVSAGVATLRRDDTARRFLNQTWQKAQRAPRDGPPCPHCMKPMAAVEVAAAEGEMEVDVCARCFCMWFDRGEREAVPREERAEPVTDDKLPDKARQLLAIHKVEEMARQAEAEGMREPEERWQALPGFLGFPVEFGAPPVASQPWMTWGVAAAMAFIFVMLTATDGHNEAVEAWGFVPSLWHRGLFLTAVTSFFLHGGLLHLAGNAYFLLVFGDNTEDELGPKRFVLLVAASHAAGLLLHAAFDPRGDIPLIGASGGISGVIAFYAIVFPRARLGFFLPVMRPWFLLGLATGRAGSLWITVPALGAFFGWLVLQSVGVWQQVGGFSNVSSLGHLGGAAVGLAAGIWVQARNARQLAPNRAYLLTDDA